MPSNGEPTRHDSPQGRAIEDATAAKPENPLRRVRLPERSRADNPAPPAGQIEDLKALAHVGQRSLQADACAFTRDPFPPATPRRR